MRRRPSGGGASGNLWVNGRWAQELLVLLVLLVLLDPESLLPA